MLLVVMCTATLAVSQRQSCEGARRPVIVIGLDGLGSAYLNERNMQAWAPNLATMFSDAAWTLDAQAFVPVLSMPNWASLLLGTSPAVTNIIDNEFTDSASIRQRCTTLMDAVEQMTGMTTSIFLNWMPLRNLIGRANPAAGTVDESSARDVVLTFLNTKLLSSFTFIHLDTIDSAGHKFGWGTPQYFNAITEADTLIGNIMKRAELDDAIVVVVADHGGLGRQHDINAPEARRVPIAFWSSRPLDINKRQIATIRNLADVAATILHVMGIPRPAHWTGASAAPDIFACDVGPAAIEASSGRSCILPSRSRRVLSPNF
ncbi:unnamed protein product (mitochondrion) [Plasmodiophora brassicae]|uniref:Uncharacterized protein n=1 Tax=Plasmodiophora brassicae TaxID=37360 RepID=A0A3P3YLD6_PLABS|nr:unnamed protein product [Plasmodiophora brassicae]